METDYLTMAEALQFIHECERRNAFIYGIERFTRESGMNVPDLDGIADFSSLPSQDVQKSISSARDFLASFGRSKEERFKIVS
ncbi:hypothetical protein GGE07_004016 [Sinorhizobium terangae]|uniref:Uncharacterized protein n=1 Tax=Sinorhizobium terangae TaxID=110322 RepID=A0A6N7LBM9_SINTE|nr:hypothetical protein [Sinorhizobium terangae]MBB4187352.1 hypothetical protein [Sinorhizobium terangae]MQX14638.1 hypothetical protein [Sinorhizobium terangae]